MGVENCILNLREAYDKQVRDYEAKIKRYEELIQDKNDNNTAIFSRMLQAESDRDGFIGGALITAILLAISIIVNIGLWFR